MPLTPRLIASYEGDRYTRLANVLKATAAQHCPDWDVRFEVVPVAVQEASKLRHWIQAVTDAPDGTPMFLMDADAMILHPLDSVWEQAFDVAYTARDPRWSPWPNNGGMMFVRASDGVRAFLREWREATLPLLQTTGAVRKAWLAKFGAVEQAALDQTLKKTSLKVVALPCVEWNCEDSSWAHFSPERTRVVHLKGALRRALFGRVTNPKRAAQVKPLVAIWRALDRGQTPEEVAPAPVSSPADGSATTYTPAWQAGRTKYQEPKRRIFESALHRLGTPGTMLDLGCGEGYLVDYARGKGIDAIGFDLSIPKGIEGSLQWADLREPFDLQRQYDLVLCWEVAEHLPLESADVLCDTIVRHLAPGGTLLFTAAHPDQGGHLHINEQPQAFWRERLVARGLTFDAAGTRVMSALWLRRSAQARWYSQNLQIFTAAGEAATFRPAPADPWPSIVLTMRTADRAPKPNYLGATLRRLSAQGTDLSALHLCVTGPSTAWLDRELAGLASPVIHAPTAKLTGNENGLAQVEAGLAAGADWIVILEDDLAFCADFSGSVRRWLHDADRPDRHLFRVFGFSRPPKGSKASAYDWPLEQLRGSQAMCIRTSEAPDFLTWGRAHLTSWCRITPWRNSSALPTVAYDKFIAAWNTARWPGVPGVMSHPYFVKHVGDKSSLHARGVRNDEPFAGEQWSYRAEEATA